MPATFGVPWADPSRLTLSFAPDGTAIAGHTSSLFQTLNAQQPTAVWQREILQAFQTWAVQANINIGLVSDGGEAFGTAGPSQHDPRFGDIRVGAQSMSPDALSISVPNDPTLSSTWGGDVLINSNDNFGSGGLDLYSVMLHEAGHVFGLGDSTDSDSPMYDQYQDNQQLTSRRHRRPAGPLREPVAGSPRGLQRQRHDQHRHADPVPRRLHRDHAAGGLRRHRLEQGRGRLLRPAPEQLQRPDDVPAPERGDQPADHEADRHGLQGQRAGPGPGGERLRRHGHRAPQPDRARTRPIISRSRGRPRTSSGSAATAWRSPSTRPTRSRPRPWNPS